MERPAKRARSTSPASSLPARPPPAPPVAHRQQPQQLPAPLTPHFIHPPQQYTPRGAPPTPFQLPLHLTSFSYSTTRELLTSEERRDEALAVYNEPLLGVDLNEGFEEATWRDGGVDEGLDALLDGLLALAERDPTSATEGILTKNNVYTWRGMMTKLLLAVYEVESAANRGGGGRAEGWEMNAMVLDGALYLEDSATPAKLAAKAASESSYKLQSYYGYSFEAFSTMPRPHPPPPPASDSSVPPPSAEPSFEPPNTNVQWCSIVKTNLGGFRTIVGGEVDCVLPREGLSEGKGEGVKTSDFVELKTNIVISSPRDEMMFERNKLLKHYTQSFLLGVPLITVGFRTRQGHLTGLQSFKTLEIPRLVRGKPHAWDPSALLAAGRALLSYIFKTVSSHPSTRSAELAPGEEQFDSWPVFRVKFDPAQAARGGPAVEIRLLDAGEVKDEVLGGKKDEERVGFLLKRWVSEVRRRRARVVEREEETRSALAESGPPPPPPPAPPLAMASNGLKPAGGLQR